MMPGLDGFGLLRALRADERTRAVPVILLSARAGEDAAIEGLAAGADDYLVKPFTARELLARVRTHLAIASQRRAWQDDVERSLREAQSARGTAVAASRAKSEFVAAMSHEIRTPMNAILGYAQLLRRDAALTPDQRRYVDVIGDSGKHLLGVINDVLEMSKIEAGHREVNRGVVDLHGMVDDMERLLRVSADAKLLRLEVHRAPELPRHVVIDEGKVRQILVNLLGNAVKFTQRGSVVARFDLRSGPTLRVDVEDTGPGIAEDELATLFESFVQARAGAETPGGTGLGLALSRKLAQLMGGDVTAESRQGEGSVFRFEVPVEIAAAPAPPRRPQRVVGLASEGEVRILVVDDHEHSRAWLGGLLAQVGFAVREAQNGAEALLVIDAWSPHLAFMDVHMPVMDGHAATRALRARPDGGRIPIVALTASAFDEERDAIFAAGVDGWLRKPCHEGEILDEIARHLGLQYRYAGPEASPRDGPPRAPTALPTPLVMELLGAARVADYERLGQLLGALPAEHAETAEALEELLATFSYDRIEQHLLGGAAPPGGEGADD